MKILNKLLLIPFLGILFFGCSKGAEEEQEQSLIGSWQLMQKTEKDVTYGRDWVNVKDGYTYTFSSDGKFLSTRFEDCTDGTYKIDSNQVIWDYGCDGFTTDSENDINYEFQRRKNVDKKPRQKTIS